MGDFNNPENTLGHDLVLASPLGLKDSHLAAKKVILTYMVCLKLSLNRSVD